MKGTAHILLFLVATVACPVSGRRAPIKSDKSNRGQVQGYRRTPSQWNDDLSSSEFDDEDLQHVSTEQRLQLHLLGGIHPMVRPVVNIHNTINVTFGFTLIQIVNLDEHRQSIDLKIWLRLKWINELMRWKPEEWGNITHSRVQPNSVWKPDIFLEEDVGQDVTNGLHSHKTSVVMHANGLHEWMVPMMLHSACQVDVTMFPFDRQNCRFVFTSWSHDQRELEMIIEDKPVLTKHYMESSEWMFISLKREVNHVKYVCCPTPYVNVEFVLTLQRMPLIYVHNLITPCVLQMIIILSTFFLPLESGERIGVVITILLVFAVYLQVLRESLPESSSSTPLLSKFFVVIMAESACLLISTCFILKIHFKGMEKGVEPVPAWAKNIFLIYLSEMFGFSSKCQQNDKFSENEVTNNIITSVIDRSGLNHPLFIGQCDSNPSLKSAHTLYRCEAVRKANDRLISRHDVLTNDVHMIKKLLQDMNRKSDIENEWIHLAKVLDRLLFFVFLVTYSLSSCAMLIPAYLILINQRNEK